jgi:hypothetical protein
MTDKQIELLQQQITKLDDKEFDLDGWKNSTIVLLNRIYGDDYPGIKSIEKIKFESGGIAFGDSSSFWDNMKSCKKQGKDLLDACIRELQTFGQPTKKVTSNSGINIHLTQNQNQTINIQLLVSALENELTVSQFREINEIMNSPESSADKKKTIIDKLKSFGSDVASNILANILTNPNIWT